MSSCTIWSCAPDNMQCNPSIWTMGVNTWDQYCYTSVMQDIVGASLHELSCMLK